MTRTQEAPFVALLAALMAWAFIAVQAPASMIPRAANAGGATSEPAAANLADLDVDFVENDGQWPGGTEFVAHNGSLSVALDGRSMTISGPDASRNLSLRFEGASRGASLVGEGERTGHYNFFMGEDPAAWRTDVSAFESVRYQQLYDGVDVRVRDNSREIEYDVLLEPGADLDDVVIGARGADRLTIGPDGALLVQVGEETLRQAPPISWEVLPDGRDRPIASRFRIIDKNRYGFMVADRDPSLPLVIDPGLDWATFLGGSGDETLRGLEVTHDGSGDIVVAGQSASPDFPKLGHPRPNGNVAAVGWTPYVARLDSTGSSLVWASFFGGTANHSVMDMSLDPSDQPVVVGDTTSLDFPTTPGAYDRTPGNGFSGDYDAYVIKFNSTGSELVFGTYLAGSPNTSNELARLVEHDPSGAPVIVGTAGGADFPRTAGAYPGQPWMFVSRFNPSGTALTYSAYLGPGEPFNMTMDAAGLLTITGQTRNSTFPTTADAFDRTFNTNADAFVTRMKLDGAGAADLKYSTFLGGAQWIEAGNGIAFDPNNPGLITVSGFTRSGDFPTTEGALLRTHFAPVDSTMGYLTRFDLSTVGSGRLVWSTFYGSPGNQTADGVTIDDAGRPIFTGATATKNPPTTERAWDRVPGRGYGRGFGPGDAYVARISADGRRNEYNSLLGGTSGDGAHEIEYLGGNSVIVGGHTDSPDFPVTTGAFDTVYAADGKRSDRSAPGTLSDDAFIARFDLVEQGGTDRTPPSAPQLVWPPEGQVYTAHHSGVAFDFTDVEDPSGIQAYHVQISPNAEFRNDFESELFGWWEPWVATSVTVRGFSISHTGPFWWRVQAIDGAGNLGPWSAVRTLQVNNPEPPAAPTLTSPPNGGRFAPGNITFAWNPAARAKFYEIQVDTTSNFSNPNRIWHRAFTETQRTISLTTERMYFWRVKASNDAVSSGPWSATRSLEIKRGSPAAPVPPPPSTPPPTQPGTGAVHLKSLTLAADITFGNSTQGTVTLNAPAPPEGAVIPLASSQPEAATVPASVTVPAGATSATFPVTTHPSIYFYQLNITGRYGGATEGYILNVYASETIAELHAFTVSTNTPLGGEIVMGTVRFLDGWPAPADGAVVALASTKPSLATVPDRVIVPAGATSATFPIRTTSVTEAQKVTIVASRSMTLRQELQILPAGALASFSIDPETVTGGESSLGRVTLAGNAPAGGKVIALSSFDTTVARVPASVTVPTGSSSVTFPITTMEVCCQGHSSQLIARDAANDISKYKSIQVNPAAAWALSSVSVSPTSVSGGASATGRVTLAGAAPNWGTSIDLSSSDPAIASVPASVMVTGAQTSATFPVTTTAVATPTTVTITARDFGRIRTTVLTVNPPGAIGLSSVGLNPTSVTGGSSSQGTVTLSGAAPSGGKVISLSSSSATASVPASVTVAAGASTANFTISTQSVSSNTSATISASDGTSTRSASLTVNAPSPPPPPPPASDTVSISRVEYDSGGRRLRVEASSSNSSAVLRCYVTSTGVLIGTLSGGRGEFSWPSNPLSITVRSSLGGSATRTVP